MSEKTAINIFVDSELLTQAGALFNELGIDMSSAFGSFLRQSLKDPTLVSNEAVEPKTDSVGAIQSFSLFEIVSCEAFEGSDSPLTVALGKTMSGEPFVFDLAEAPHLLIGGKAGSGKSICLHALIMSILFKSNPPDLRLILIDPKGTEFWAFERNPYLLMPTITDMKKVCAALSWATQEIERRFSLMEHVGVRNFRELNEKIFIAEKSHRPLLDPSSTEEEPKPLKKLPYIVLVISELADLVLSNRKKVETLIMRLTERAHVAGIHLVMATQRPSADFLAPILKTCPTRIAFKTDNLYDSTAILNQGGAENLHGNGEMFFMSPDTPLLRLQGAMIDYEEIKALSLFLSTQIESKYIDIPVGDGEQLNQTDSVDVLYDKAVKIVIEEQRAGISFLQRKLGINSVQATKLLERMETEGVVSKPTPTGRRKVLVTGSNT